MGTEVEANAGPQGFLRTARFRQFIFANIMTLAGATGLVLLAVPGSTSSFFSWGLDPAALAALVGGLYVGSASTFGLGISRVRVASRGLCLMSIVFTAPTLVVTLMHLAVFDFGRWQAWLWLLLFAGAPLFFVVLLALGAWHTVGAGPQLRAWARVALLLMAAAALAGGVALVLDPIGSGAWLPFEVPPLGGRFLGVWLAVLAFACAWSAFRPAEEAVATVFAACALVGGALVGAIRTYGLLDPGKRPLFVSVLGGALVLSLAVLLSARGPPPDVPSSSRLPRG